MFKISKKLYKLFYSIYFPVVILGMFSQNTFVPSQGYKTFSYLFVWILAIWITIVSIPYMREKAKKQFLGKYIPTELLSLMAVIVFAHFNALLLFKSVPLLTKYIATSERIINYPIKYKGVRDTRAFLACDQFLQLEDSGYYGKLCVTKKFYDTKRNFDMINHKWDSVKVFERKNMIGNYIEKYE